MDKHLVLKGQQLILSDETAITPAVLDILCQEVDSGVREYVRYLIQKPINCYDTEQRLISRGELCNLSPKGISLLSDDKLVSSQVILLENEWLRAAGTIKHLQNGHVGCEFLDLKWLAQNLLIHKII